MWANKEIKSGICLCVFVCVDHHYYYIIHGLCNHKIGNMMSKSMHLVPKCIVISISNNWSYSATRTCCYDVAISRFLAHFRSAAVKSLYVHHVCTERMLNESENVWCAHHFAYYKNGETWFHAIMSCTHRNYYKRILSFIQ